MNPPLESILLALKPHRVPEGTLLPCPFCGETEFVKIIDDGVSPIRVVCNRRRGAKGCGAAGAATGLRRTAIAAWNTRASLALTDAVRDAVAGLVEACAALENIMFYNKLRSALARLARALGVGEEGK